MATRVNGVYGVTNGVLALTALNGAFGHVKWETGGSSISVNGTFTDSLSNTWTVAQQLRHPTGNEPGSALIYCLSITTGGSATVTPTFTGGSPTFQHIELEQWSPTGGTVFALDTVATSATGTGTGAAFHYNAVSATASASGLAIFGVSDFNTITWNSSGGTPAFVVPGSVFNGDSFIAYATTTAGSVSPDIGASGGTTRWIQQLMLIKETTANPTSVAWLTA